MSILNGNISNNSIYPETPPFGKRLKETALIPLERCHDVEINERSDCAFAVHNNGLSAYDISNKANPILISTLEGIVQPREIKIMNGVAFIVARANGLYIVDISNPSEMKMLSTYDTIELASSVDVSNDGLCFVSNRHLGVEIIDVKNPSEPKYISSFMCGEAQSVFACEGYLYIGDWMNKQVYIVNIEDPKKPKVASILQTDGFSDGVFVLDKICYVVTGHHSSNFKNRQKYENYPFITPEMIADGYGCGHGLEIFDVSDPEHPEWISGIKFPPLFGAPDIWKVTVSDNTAYVSDSNNGLFIVNTEDLHNPYIEAYFLDKISLTGNTKPGVQVRHAPILNCACADGYIYLAGYESGLYVVEYEKSKRERRNPTFSSSKSRCKYNAHKLFSCNGQIHNTVEYKGYYLIAAGNDGLLAVDDKGNVKHKIAQGRTVSDVRCGYGFVFAAEGCDGTAVYSFDEQAGFVLRDRIFSPKKFIHTRHLAVLTDGIIAMQIGEHDIDFARISNDGKLTHIDFLQTNTLMYYRNLCQPLLCGKYFGCTSLNKGVSWFKISHNGIERTEYTLGRETCPIECGVAATEEYAVIIFERKYAVLRDITRSDASKLDFKSVDGANIKGIPFICGSKLVLVNRCLATVEIIDISNPDNPIFEDRLTVDGYPCSAELINGEICVSCGHGGVYVIK